MALAFEVVEERQPQRRLVQAHGEGGASAAGGREAIDRGATALAEHEFELAELVRLEAAGLLEPLAERLELERGHRLEDVELRDQHLQDGEDALQGVLGAGGVVGVEQHADAVELVEDFLEPQLVDLVDDDEEQLVMFRSVGARLLQGQQLIDFQVGVVGDRAFHATGSISCDGWHRTVAIGARPQHQGWWPEKKEAERPLARRALRLKRLPHRSPTVGAGARKGTGVLPPPQPRVTRAAGRPSES